MAEYAVDMAGSLKDRLEGTNINPETFLATDYLNHFNEGIMLIELVPDMPEMLEDAQNWAPKSYADHFRDSTFSDKELAIEAYENAPAPIREAFDAVIARIDRAMLETLADLGMAVQANDQAMLQEITTTACRNIRSLLDQASAIIHGSRVQPGAEAEEADMAAAMAEQSGAEGMEDAEITMNQDDIDALFD